MQRFSPDKRKRRMYNNLQRYIKDRSYHLILEGADGTGKSTLAQAIYDEASKYMPVLMLKNPNSPDLYKQMHDGVLTSFQIAMSTLSDALELHIKHYEEFLSGHLIVQDRSAIVSGYVYNITGMNDAEKLIYSKSIQICGQILYDNAHIVILDNEPMREESTVFSKYTAGYKGLIARPNLYQKKLGLYTCEGAPEDDAKTVLELLEMIT